MSNKSLLLVDDSSEHCATLDNIKVHLKAREGIELTTHYVNPTDRIYWNEEKDPDLCKVIVGIKKCLVNECPSLIVVDQYYSDVDFNGLNLIEELRKINKFKRSPVILISGKRPKIIKDVFLKEVPVEKKVDDLAKLLQLGIHDFIDKDFKSQAIEILKSRSINDTLPVKLREYEDRGASINLFSPKYKKISFNELAEKIDANGDEAVQILNEILDITLAHYLKIDESL